MPRPARDRGRRSIQRSAFLETRFLPCRFCVTQRSSLWRSACSRPAVFDAVKQFLKPSIDWLFAFIPTSVALEHDGGVSAPLLFFSAALAIVPIARLIVLSTEQIATRT